MGHPTCPHCVEAKVARREQPFEVRKIPAGSAGDRLDLLHALYVEKHGPVGLESGSYAEEDALRRIIDARQEEEDREAAKSAPHSQGVLVSARPENGRWVETWRVGPRLVRVGPET